MELTKNSKRQIVTFTVLLLLGLGTLFVWLQSRVIHDDADLKVIVYPLMLQTGDTLFFADRSTFANQRKWDFGDGSVSLSDSGTYRYAKAGYYHVKLLVNGRYSRIIHVQVSERAVTNELADSLVVINAPKAGMQYENIIFRCNALHATAYRWKFGETGNIDSKDQQVIYAYQKPGNYTVMLYTNTTEYPVRHQITILPAFKTINDSIAFDDTYRKIDDDFKQHLQQIANGKAFNTTYNYLLHTYLCDNEKAVMKINGSRINDFNSYCLGLQFDKGTTIQSVKCGFDDKQQCVTKVEIQQGK